jgi:hypothetical protein
MLDDWLVFCLAGSHIVVSNLLSWSLHLHQSSRPLLTRTILTHLHNSIIIAYNLHTSIISLSLLLRSGLGPLPLPVAAACMFLCGVVFFSLVGLHVALAFVRYLTVTYFSWLQPQAGLYMYCKDVPCFAPPGVVSTSAMEGKNIENINIK